MAPMPGAVTVKANPDTTVAAASHPDTPGQQVSVGSLADVQDRTKNPGYPFWVAGIEQIVGQRPTTPPLDLATHAKVDELVQKATLGSPTYDPSYAIYAKLKNTESGGWDGGLPRHALRGYAATPDPAAATEAHQTRFDLTKVVHVAKPEYFPGGGNRSGTRRDAVPRATVPQHLEA